MVQIGTPKNIVESSKKTIAPKVEEVEKTSSTDVVVEETEVVKATKKRK